MTNTEEGHTCKNCLRWFATAAALAAHAARTHAVVIG